MQIVGISPEWSEDQEGAAEALELLLARIRTAAPPGLVIGTADAMMGASYTTILFNMASAATIALAIMDAPTIIEENWPKWKQYYDQVIEFSSEIFEDFSIDRNTAEVLAIKAVHPNRVGDEHIAVDFRFRHVGGMVTFLENLDETRGRVVEDTPDGNAEATSQFGCRYIFGISVGSNRFTVLVENDGEITFCEMVGR